MTTIPPPEVMTNGFWRWVFWWDSGLRSMSATGSERLGTLPAWHEARADADQGPQGGSETSRRGRQFLINMCSKHTVTFFPTTRENAANGRSQWVLRCVNQSCFQTKAGHMVCTSQHTAPARTDKGKGRRLFCPLLIMSVGALGWAHGDRSATARAR